MNVSEKFLYFYRNKRKKRKFTKWRFDNEKLFVSQKKNYTFVKQGD